MISIVYARDINDGIGFQGDLPWKGKRLRRDMRRFRELTEGSAVLMGRKTWDSLDARFRPLPNRLNAVLSRDITFAPLGCMVFNCFESALNGLKGDIAVIGGLSLYQEALPIADVIYETLVEFVFQSDTRFSVGGLKGWEIIEQTRYAADNDNDFSCQFTMYAPIITA